MVACVACSGEGFSSVQNANNWRCALLQFAYVAGASELLSRLIAMAPKVLVPKRVWELLAKEKDHGAWAERIRRW
jgi:hypothetical protein